MKDYYLDEDKKPNKNKYTEEVPQCRPWVRYFSRMLDMLVFGYIVGLMKLIFYPSRNFSEDLSFGIVLLVLWTLVEAKLLSTWGTTPGKWLFKTKVRDNNSNKLSFSSALKRSLLVFVLGLGLGTISLITMILSFMDIDPRGATSWDKRCKCVVIHERIGALRSIIVSSITIGFIVLSIISMASL